MSELTIGGQLARKETTRRSGIFVRLVQVSWRNVWRNRRRTLLTAGGIIFAVWLLVFMRSFQGGIFAEMADISARAMPGHTQIQHPLYEEEPLIEHTVSESLAESRLVQTDRFEFISSRLQGSAILSVGDKSSAGMVLGVEPEVEARWSGLALDVKAGAYLASAGEAVIGEVMARNLGAEIGDDLIILGTAKNGGIAAHAGQIVGILRTGVSEVDRTLVQIPIADFREAWSMEAEDAHMVVGVSRTLLASEDGTQLARDIQGPGAEFSHLAWQDLLPEIVAMTEMKDVGTQFMFYFICIIVGFSVINAFMMLIYERTNEMGVLLALGMRPHQLLIQFQIEAFLISLLGLILGFAFTLITLWPLKEFGIVFPESLLENYPPDFATKMPERLYPAYNWESARIAMVVIVLGIQVAALIPCLRIFGLRPVEAIRAEN